MNQRNRTIQRMDLMNDRAFAEVKSTMASARGLRDALASLAMRLAENEDQQGYLLLLDPGLSHSFLEKELSRFKAALRMDLVDRLHLVVAKRGQIEGNIRHIPQNDLDLLYRGLRLEKAPLTHLISPSKQDEVFLVMLHQWVLGHGPMTSKWLEHTVGCNYRTVASAIDRLGHAVRRHSDRSVSLKYFPEQDWGRLLAVVNRVRSTMLFADASSQPRSPESLLKRLSQLNRKEVAVGGVLGAKFWYEELDMVGTPRLDLCIHCPGNQVDIEFVRKLDPALERTRDPHRPAQLALHFIRRDRSFFEQDNDRTWIADPVECLLELYGARLDQQARSFQNFLIMRGKELSGNGE